MHYFLICSILLTLWQLVTTATASTYCSETTKKHMTITGIRAVWVPISKYMPTKLKSYSNKLTEKRIKYEVVKKCCDGYSMNNFDVCEPICKTRRCSELEECTEPNVCRCKRGYAKAIDSLNATCLPICAEDCGQHAHCQAPNLCACNEAYVSNSSDATAVVQCQRRCRAGVLWDAMTLECVERQEANVTVIAAEMDLFMPDLEITPVDVEQLDAYVGVLITTSRSLETIAPKTFSCLTLVHALIVLAVTMFLLTFASVTLYILKRRQNNYGNIILEDKNDLPGEYFIDRSQIMVY